jgi:hypothetical protein
MIGLVVVLMAAVGLVWYANRPSSAAQARLAPDNAAPAARPADDRQARDAATPGTTTPGTTTPGTTTPETATTLPPMDAPPAGVDSQPETPMPAPSGPPPPTPSKKPPATKAPPGPNGASRIRLSDLTITKTTFEPPSVEFTVRLDLAGGELLEAWASVGVPDAGKTLEVFAGALYKGLLSVNGIDFAKPDPALKAQRVSMKKSANDANVYVCAVRYPKLILDDPETEFTMVAAVDKDQDIVKTNAVMARVNLKTGKVLSAPNAKVHGQVSAWLAGVEHRPGLIDWVHSLAE